MLLAAALCGGDVGYGGGGFTRPPSSLRRVNLDRVTCPKLAGRLAESILEKPTLGLRLDAPLCGPANGEIPLAPPPGAPMAVALDTVAFLRALLAVDMVEDGSDTSIDWI